MDVSWGKTALVALSLLSSYITPSNAEYAPEDAYPVLSSETVEKLGNNSLFTRWRPRSHFLSPHSWMNDPCGSFYDPETQLYHLYYQFRPNHVSWGNISWGHGVSKDLFHWTDVNDWVNDSAVSLAAGKYSSGPLSQFTGTSQPVNLEGKQDGKVLVLGTGIHHLPTNWKIPYQEGTEVQALYLSEDGGNNWEEVGTVLSGPPKGWNVTGWRDPSFFPSPLLDEITGSDEPRYYMVLGSGLKGGGVPATLPGAERPNFIGPRIPLYAAPASNLTDWSFLGALWEPKANSSLGDPDVTGSYGYNFEVSSFFPLNVSSTGEKAWFITSGAEGGNTTSHWREQWALWNRGDVVARANKSVEFQPTSGAALDWGLAYAHATWEDTKNQGRRVMWSWASEDIADEYFMQTAKQFGYQGSMTLPTELFIKETTGVLNCPTRPEGSQYTTDNNGTITAQTLGIRPLPDVLKHMRRGSEHLRYKVLDVASWKQVIDSNLGDSYELRATLKSWNGAGRVGLILGQSLEMEEYTVLYFDPNTNTIGLDREHSTLLPQFRTLPFEGHFEPYTLDDGTEKGKQEELDFHVVVDGSLVEVWVNERFSLTARIYPSRNDSAGLSVFAGRIQPNVSLVEDDGIAVTARWSNVQVYKGLADAWTERPDDTSVPLRWDSAEETGDYAWWTGY